MNLRTRLSIIFAVIIILLIVTLSAVIGYHSFKQVQNEIGNSLGETAYLLENNLDQYMWSRYGETKILSGLKELQQPKNAADIRRLLNRLQDTFPAFAWIGYTDPKGKVIAATDGILEGADISARPVYTEALKGTFVGDVHEAVLLADLLPNPTGEEMKFVDISTPVYDETNELVGVLGTHLSWEWIKEVEASVMDSLKNQQDVEFFIVSKKDRTIIVGPDQLLGQQLDLESMELARTEKNGWTLETWEDEERYLTGYMLEDGYQEYPGLDWTILVRQPVAVAYVPLKKMLMYFLVTGFFAVMLFALLGWFIAGKIVDPLKRISDVADELRAGNIVEIPSYKGIKEIESLTKSLRKLVANLMKTESALEEMEDAAFSDHLTGLPNRKGFELYLEKATEVYSALVVLYVDLDGFKAVNDTLGHHAGDELLKQVALRLKNAIRTEELVARIGGDEFIVVLNTGNDPVKGGRAAGERIVSSINQPYEIGGHAVSISCSIGGTVWDGQHENMSDSIKAADKALYAAKYAGKNQVLFLQSVSGEPTEVAGKMTTIHVYSGPKNIST